ncbi:MAG: ergothioneine biosynthesis protein EgtC [Pseudonocardiaceae bacterium]|nr:ergothioneine biosynthesis protein EgtC [Pseudonocardiaceae bacterium]
MCRHLAYLGPPVDLATLLCEPPHSLLRQSYAPADMRGGGTVNADGFGAGWYQPGGEAPSRYRRAVPMWTDTSFAGLAPTVRSGAVLAAVRAASPGMPVVETACAPFRWGGWLFSHNGVVRGWPGSVASLAARLPVTDLLTLDAPTDSALLAALVADRLRAGADAAAALSTVVAEVAAAAPNSRLNLLLTDGRMIAATAVRHALSVRRADGAVVVASEPIDHHPGWQRVPDNHLLVATPAAVDLRAIAVPTTTAEEP